MHLWLVTEILRRFGTEPCNGEAAIPEVARGGTAGPSRGGAVNIRSTGSSTKSWDPNAAQLTGTEKLYFV